MLNSKQLKLLLLARKYDSDNNDVSMFFPVDLIRTMSEFHDPDADKLVQFIADGKKDEAKKMLEANPRLVLQAANVVTPGGMTLKRIMPYECALIGDPDMALMVGEYFEKIGQNNNAVNDECKKLREEQFKRYEKAIENMLNVKPYDFTKLIDIIKASSPTDVNAELNHAKDYQSALRTELEKFRKVFAPCTKKTPEQQFAYISFIYMSLLKAFKVYNAEWDNLSNHGNNYDKCRLVWCQLIGFIERRLPAVDRQAFAQGVDTIKGLHDMKRSLAYKYDPQNEFPRTDFDDDSHSGLGFDFGVSIFGETWRGLVGVGHGGSRCGLKTYVEQKHQDLKKLSSSCNIEMRNTN